MGLEFELELHELAALRPIRTAVSSAPVLDDDVDGAAGTGCCVTPATTASDDGVAPRHDGGVVDAGCVTPTSATAGGAAAGASTVRRDDGGEADGAAVDGSSTGCATPTSAANTLGPATVCPPAPRKPRPAKRKRCGRAPAPQRFFFPVPHDLAAVFVARAAPASPAPFQLPDAAKKIRVHVVG